MNAVFPLDYRVINSQYQQINFFLIQQTSIFLTQYYILVYIFLCYFSLLKQEICLINTLVRDF